MSAQGTSFQMLHAQAAILKSNSETAEATCHHSQCFIPVLRTAEGTRSSSLSSDTQTIALQGIQANSTHHSEGCPRETSGTPCTQPVPSTYNHSCTLPTETCHRAITACYDCKPLCHLEASQSEFATLPPLSEPGSHPRIWQQPGWLGRGC